MVTPLWKNMTNIEKKWVKLENRTMKVLKSEAKTCHEEKS